MTFNIIGAGDQHMLVSGMKVSQAINDARRWWNKIGREHPRAARDRPHDGIRNDEEMMNLSGVFTGRMFDECSVLERNEIVRAWHHAWCMVELGIDEEEYLRRARMGMLKATNGKSMDTDSGLLEEPDGL